MLLLLLLRGEIIGLCFGFTVDWDYRWAAGGDVCCWRSWNWNLGLTTAVVGFGAITLQIIVRIAPGGTSPGQ